MYGYGIIRAFCSRSCVNESLNSGLSEMDHVTHLNKWACVLLVRGARGLFYQSSTRGLRSPTEVRRIVLAVFTNRPRERK